MTFIRRLHLSAFCLGLLSVAGLIVFGLSKIPHIEYAIIGAVFLAFSYAALVIVTAIVSFIIWLFSGKDIFSDWMIL